MQRQALLGLNTRTGGLSTRSGGLNTCIGGWARVVQRGHAHHQHDRRAYPAQM